MLNIAVVGANHGLVHARNVRHCVQTNLVAICTRSKCLPSEFSDVKAYADILSMLTSEKLSGVIVASPPYANKLILPPLIQANLPILVEKPVACSSKEIIDIIECAEQAMHNKILIGHHRRFSPRIALLKQTIEAGLLGRLLGVSVLWCLKKNPNYFSAGLNNWKINRKLGGGLLRINLSHEIDTLRYLFGEIDDIVGLEKTKSQIRIENAVALAIQFQSGVLATIFASDDAPGPFSYEKTSGENPLFPSFNQDHMHIFGSAASLSFPSMRLYHNRDGGDWFSPVIVDQKNIPDSNNDPLVTELNHFISVIKCQCTPLITLYDAYQNMKLIDRFSDLSDIRGV